MQTTAKEPVQTKNGPDEWYWTDHGWDRRTSVRLELNYPLHLLRAGAPCEVVAETQNVSFSGFYFQSAAPFHPQERVEYEMIMPWSASPGSQPVEMILRGSARVVRVDVSRPGAPSGIACHLEGDYTITRRDEAGSSLMRYVPVTAQAC
jgi:hypothetical protein